MLQIQPRVNESMGSSPGGEGYSRMSKVGFPRFDGRDIEGYCCDDRNTPGHKCEAQIYTLKLTEEVDHEEGEACSEEFSEDQGVVGEERTYISMHAIAGVNTYQTMRVIGKLKRRPLHILIDAGSTHNFLDIGTARKLNCDVRSTVPLQVLVANGAKLIGSAMCKGFTWSIH